MWDVSVTEWGDVFSGKYSKQGQSRPYRAQANDYARWDRVLSTSETAQRVLHSTESAKEFFKIEKDLALMVPKEERTEFFYSLKNGFCAPNCPAQFIYFAKAIYKVYGICNLIGPMLPRLVSLAVMKEGYFGAGYTATDAICNFVNKDFQAITEERPIVRIGEWYEVYIPVNGMVAALPIKLGESLSSSDLERITVQPGSGLTLNGKPLEVVAGMQRARGGIYDLR